MCLSGTRVVRDWGGLREVHLEPQITVAVEIGYGSDLEDFGSWNVRLIAFCGGGYFGSRNLHIVALEGLGREDEIGGRSRRFDIINASAKRHMCFGMHWRGEVERQAVE